ncbi:hypothetical protein [Methylomonas koyamae]|nr:hypothetical protein [Methylomonas koyamae]
MTPAEKQRAYRQRLKSGNVTKKAETQEISVVESVIDCDLVPYDAARIKAILVELAVASADAKRRQMEVEELKAKLERAGADAEQWRKRYYDTVAEHQNDVAAILQEQGRKLSAQKALATKFQNERNTQIDKNERLRAALAGVLDGYGAKLESKDVARYRSLIS